MPFLENTVHVYGIYSYFNDSITWHSERADTSYFVLSTDRYILLGNHRDAWVFGAVDPSSGTAIMMEVSRVLAQLVKQGKYH